MYDKIHYKLKKKKKVKKSLQHTRLIEHPVFILSKLTHYTSQVDLSHTYTSLALREQTPIRKIWELGGDKLFPGKYLLAG